MGFKEWAAQGAAINEAKKLSGSFEGMTLTPDNITYKRETCPIAGAVARVDNGADVRRRVTATRVLTVGVFALATKKQVGHLYLTIEGNGFAFMVEVPVKKETKAREFAAKVNNAAKR